MAVADIFLLCPETAEIFFLHSVMSATKAFFATEKIKQREREKRNFFRETNDLLM